MSRNDPPPGRRAGVAAGSALGLVLAALPLPHRDAAAKPPQTCVVSVTPLQFGNYNPSNPTGSMVTGNVVFNCAQSQPVTIFMDHGNGSASGMRRMRGPGVVDFNIYFDAAATRIWGDGAGGSTFYSNAAPPPGTNVVIPFYGLIPGRQRQVTVGGYADSIIVRMNY